MSTDATRLNKSHKQSHKTLLSVQHRQGQQRTLPQTDETRGTSTATAISKEQARAEGSRSKHRETSASESSAAQLQKGGATEVGLGFHQPLETRAGMKFKGFTSSWGLTGKVLGVVAAGLRVR